MWCSAQIHRDVLPGHATHARELRDRDRLRNERDAGCRSQTQRARHDRIRAAKANLAAAIFRTLADAREHVRECGVHVEPGRVACGRCDGGANRVGERRWHASRVRRRVGESLPALFLARRFPDHERTLTRTASAWAPFTILRAFGASQRSWQRRPPNKHRSSRGCHTTCLPWHRGLRNDPSTVRQLHRRRAARF